jgi:hypothetical protein
MNLIFIYGPPGVGKFTVAAQLASITGYRLWHNHVSIDAVLPIFGWGTPSLGPLVHQIRRLVLEEASAQRVNLITTYLYAHPGDIRSVEEYCQSYERKGGRVCAVQLVCDKATLDSRVQSEDRASRGKVHTLELVDRMQEQFDFSSPVPNRESLVIDNTNIPPEEVARRIVAHYSLPTFGLSASG